MEAINNTAYLNNKSATGLNLNLLSTTINALKAHIIVSMHSET